MSLTQLPNAKILGPIPEGFDFEKHKAVPEAIACSELPLSSRLAHNREVELFNDKSVTATVKAKLTAVPRPVDLNVGPPLKASYSLTEDELNDLVASEALCSAYALLPLGLLRLIISERALKKKAIEADKSADREKEKDQAKTRSKLLGTLRIDNPIERKMGEPDAITIPTVYFVHIATKACPPLNFFTNKCIETVNFSPQSVAMKQVRTWGLDEVFSEKVYILDLQKMSVTWGNDDLPSCLTPLRFIEASKNLLKTLELVSEPAAALKNPLATTLAIEYKKHFDFFQNLDNFESSFAVWYPFELKSRWDILAGHKFTREYAVMKVEVLLATHSASHSSSKRPATDSLTVAAKIPRQSFHSEATSSQSQSFRDSSPVCLLCGKGHHYKEHSAQAANFDDGKPLFSCLTNGNITTARSFKGSGTRRICAVWNLRRNCDGRHGSDFLHVCSLCGGDHPALERNAGCTRVTDSRIKA